ncbi:uncharacterized protein RHO25_001859 [Cercospora beticola]|uniref:Uncharacterized protein n=1 Tax=Cercospora beticola TaxID=122368 RepID=A0ABZ0NCI8_CERBT|nr:hypothetical protein RHO25_001859 [Cercospora beticola]
MPKAQSTTRKRTTHHDPLAKPNKSSTSSSSSSRTGRNSHLYTDDNPKTTIHGTGFKDRAAAERTLKLIEQRSLIYQFQTVNTMFNRAKHHPSMKKAASGSASTADMRAAMDVFRNWLDVTYPEAQASLRAGGFKPLLSKKVVERHLSRIQDSDVISEKAKQFAKVYCELPKGKKLGNVLVDDSKPMEPDWERARYMELDQLVPPGAGKEDGQDAWKISELWVEDGVLSDQHLHLFAWAWSPVPEKKLP